MCHVARRDGGGSRLDEVYLVGVSGQSVGTELQYNPDAGKNTYYSSGKGS
jgi:hypothetical protein